MISGIAFTFVILPCMGAVAIAALLTDWRLAAAAVAGGLALAFAAPALGALGLFALPFAIGIALGGLIMAISLWRDAEIDLWSRMLRALLFSFAAAFLNLLLFANGA